MPLLQQLRVLFDRHTCKYGSSYHLRVYRTMLDMIRARRVSLFSIACTDGLYILSVELYGDASPNHLESERNAKMALHTTTTPSVPVITPERMRTLAPVAGCPQGSIFPSRRPSRDDG